MPDCIVGDLDSLETEVGDYYRSHGVSIVPDWNQDATDFTKSLSWISNHYDSSLSTSSIKSSSIAPEEASAAAAVVVDAVAYGATGGRVYQTFHSIHQLFVASQDTRLRRKVTLVSDESVTFLLEKGRNVINTPLSAFGKTCGLIPVAGPSVITTEGLEWDLNETETRFGGMVSTSNHLVKDQVEVVTTELLLFTMEIRKAKQVLEVM